ncbi:sphingomyelin phosphodiesterase 3-like isoform 1-T1 [Salvelinus alpinus]|uniref:sphingomyelin phosphodiesterase 3-like n=1 Tax=Salvelinus alpinus TaxID=8036 RepID=UPI0039FBB342
MVLHTSPYSSAFLRCLSSLSWGFIFPCYWLLDRLLSSCVATSLEKRRRSQDPCSFVTLYVLVSTPLYLLLLLSSLPFALLGFLLWATLQAARHPYLYTHRRPDKHQAEQGGVASLADWRPQGRSFCFGSSNVCLLPDSLARFNNLSETQRRAREVGKRIRNGASRPQIKIYIDSPTNTSISATSFSSLVTGFRRTSSLGQRPDNTAEAETEPVTDCPIHTAGSDCPLHTTGPNCPIHSTGDQGSSDCPVHVAGGENTPECPLHTAGSQNNSDCPLHTTGAQNSPDCPMHASGVQISISAPEPDPPEAGTGNHQREGDAESLTGGVSSNNTLSHRTSMFKKHTGRKRRQGDDGFDHEISAFFPANLDFLCLQEVFDHRAMSRLRHQLHHYFPYILSDVGRYAWKGCCSHFKFLNSGVMLASRYPILDAHYECYPNGQGEDALAAKGVLFVKVQVGTSHQEQRVVGYLTCTHLHAIEGDAAVRCEQLDLLLAWGAEFRKMTSRPSEEKGLEDQVAFDVVLGDLNFDNCSSEDKLEQQHAVFTQYKDPCRLGPGEDKPWALGTLLDTSGLYDEEVSSPESLQKVMENEEGRKEYLVFPTNKNQCPNQKGRKIPLKGNGRRIDYILYREEVQQDWKVDIEEFSFITQLAGLTDHLSVAMRLAVSTGEEEP